MPTGCVSLQLQPTRHAPGLARQAVRDCGADWPEETLRVALIVVSELVTNALRHGEGMITVAIETRSQAVAIAVSDHGSRGLTMLNRPPDADEGRGLGVVEKLSTAWGVRPSSEGPGKAVWARLGDICPGDRDQLH